MRASVVISTKNRRNELRAAIRSVLDQTVVPEIIVLDDGSIDGTFDMIRKEFPEVKVHRSQQSLGYVSQRNRGAGLAEGDIIFSIDDDAVFQSSRTIEQTLQDFDTASIGAVAIPYIEPKKSSSIYQSAPHAQSRYVTDTFVGTAHAIRKAIFLQLGRYRDLLIHQWEEMDLCLRMLDAGYVVRLGNADPIYHLESPLRDHGRMDYYGTRNSIIFAFINVPWPYVPFHLIATTYNVLTWTFDPRRFINRSKAVIDAYEFGFRNVSLRDPVSRRTYRLFRQLRIANAEALASIEESLAPRRFG